MVSLSQEGKFQESLSRKKHKMCEEGNDTSEVSVDAEDYDC